MAGIGASLLAGRTVTPAAGERTGAAAHDGAAPQAGALTAHDEPIAAHDGPMVAHVHDAPTGVVDLFIGTRHVRFTDRQLAARLARAAQA
jgi:hypothetical protein